MSNVKKLISKQAAYKQEVKHEPENFSYCTWRRTTEKAAVVPNLATMLSATIIQGSAWTGTRIATNAAIAVNA